MPEKLLALEGVESILIQNDQITVTAEPRGDWTPLAQQVGEAEDYNVVPVRRRVGHELSPDEASGSM